MYRFVQSSLCTIACALLLTGAAHAQTRSEATKQGAVLVGGAVSFTSQGGMLYEDLDGNTLTTVAVAPGVLYFATPGVGVGGDISFAKVSQGSETFTAIAAGPRAAYFWDRGNTTIPFVGGGVNYLTVNESGNSGNGMRIKGGGGFLIRKDHLALSFELGYLYDRFKAGGFTVSGNSIVFGIGFGGFLY
jgi:hypothetical protein